MLQGSTKEIGYISCCWDVDRVGECMVNVREQWRKRSRVRKCDQETKAATLGGEEPNPGAR